MIIATGQTHTTITYDAYIMSWLITYGPYAHDLGCLTYSEICQKYSKNAICEFQPLLRISVMWNELKLKGVPVDESQSIVSDYGP